MMRTNQARMGMRATAVANQYQMSMDSIMREFGALASELAVLGASGGGTNPLAAFSSTNDMTIAISNAFPQEWTAAGGIIDANARVSHWAAPGTTVNGSPNLMTTAADWRRLNTKELRSSLLPAGQAFIGRSWGYQAEVSVSVRDNLAGLATSWQRSTIQNNEYDNTWTTNSDDILYSNNVSTFMTITEIPSQFSIQGQNINMTNQRSGHRHQIAGKGGQAATILGRSVDMSRAVSGSVSTNTKVVARGGIAKGANQMWESRVFADTNRRVAMQAEAGAGAGAVMEETGSAVLVNVGTRGREIFRSAGDYEDILSGTGRIASDASRRGAVNEFLKYWLPYYQCNFKITVGLSPVVRHGGEAGPHREYTMTAMQFVTPANMAVPSRRDNVVDLGTRAGVPIGLQAPTNNTIQAEGRTSLHRLANNGGARAVNVVMRALNSRGGTGGTTNQWVNTIDIDLESLFTLIGGNTLPSWARALGVTGSQWTSLPIALHIDIREYGGGGVFTNAHLVPIVIRKARVLQRPVSIVTPGTIHIQGKFGSENIAGRSTPHPFSLFAPQIRYGMEGRRPSNVGIRGQRVGVGGGTNRTTDILSVASGANASGGGALEVRSATGHFSNIDASSGAPGAKLPPVFLKDWLIETYNNF